MADSSLLTTIFRWLGYAQYNQTPPVVSNAQTSPLQCDSSGRLIVNVGSYGGTTAPSWADQFPAASGVVKNQAGALYSFFAGNCSGSSLYLMVFDAAAVPADGTIPTIVIPMNDGDADLWQFVRPKGFTAGIVWAASSTPSALTIVSGAKVGMNAEYI